MAHKGGILLFANNQYIVSIDRKKVDRSSLSLGANTLLHVQKKR